MIYSKQELQDILQWKVPVWKVPLFYWDKNVDWHSVHHCLEIGAREGGLSLWLAKHGKEVHCSDIQNPQNTAEKIHRQYPYTQNKIQYLVIDASQPFLHSYDLIVTKSVLGGIGHHHQFHLIEKTIQNIYNALKPNGYYLFAENASASILHQIIRKKFNQWAYRWYYLTIKEMKHLLHSYQEYHIHTFGFISPFFAHNITSYIDKTLHTILPSTAEYLIYGMARKIK